MSNVDRLLDMDDNDHFVAAGDESPSLAEDPFLSLANSNHQPSKPTVSSLSYNVVNGRDTGHDIQCPLRQSKQE